MFKKTLLSSVVVASLCIPALAKDNNTQSGQDWFHYDNSSYNASNDQSSSNSNSDKSAKEAKENQPSNVEQDQDFSSKSSEQLSSEDTSLKLSPRKGLYFSVSAGASAPFDNSTADGSSSISFKTGPTANAAIGTYLGDFRAEAEIGYSLSDLDYGTVSGTTINGSGHFDSLSFMGNLYYDLHLTPTLDFYVGGGAGAAHEYGEFSAPGYGTQNGKDWVFAYQAMGGFALQVSKGAFLTLGYRYWRSFQPTLGNTKYNDPEIHQAMIGLRIDL